MNKKKVPLTVSNNTDGTDKITIGTAEVHDIPNGDKIVDVVITNPEFAQLLGGTHMKGIVPGMPPFTRAAWNDEEDLMSDADSARMATALQEVARHLRELVRVQTALNGNIVTMARDAKEFMDSFNTVTMVDMGQLKLDDPATEDVLGKDESQRQRPDLHEVANLMGVPVKTDETMPPGTWKMDPDGS
jgi:hypothetical protein